MDFLSWKFSWYPFCLCQKTSWYPPFIPTLSANLYIRHSTIVRHSIIRLCRLSEETIVESLRDTPPPFIPLFLDNQPLFLSLHYLPLFSFKYRLVYSSIISPFHQLMVENKVYVFFWALQVATSLAVVCLLISAVDLSRWLFLGKRRPGGNQNVFGPSSRWQDRIRVQCVAGSQPRKHCENISCGAWCE